MLTKTLALSALVAFTEARFGQEQCQPALGDIQAVTSGGQPGQAATIAGGAISNLLAATDPCDQLRTADNIVATLGTGADSIKAAKEFLNCEKNFNQFTQSVPTVCDDPTLPATAELRGILPKVDPAVGGQDVANALAAQSLTTPLNADGLSIAGIFEANGFSNFTTKVGGTAANAGAANAGAANAGAANGGAANAGAAANGTADASGSADQAGNAGADDECDAEPAAAAGATGNAGDAGAAAGNATGNAAGNAGATGNAGAAAGSAAGASSVAGADFGKCDPTMIFESGLNGRKATEFTFQAADPKIRAIQQEALNFNIITNRILDELTNQCEANDAAKTLTSTAKAAIANLGRVRSTADAWNSMLGFAGANTNPDNTSTVGEPQ